MSIFLCNFVHQSYVLMQLDKQIYEEINEYCKINGLKTRDFIHKLLKEAFMKEKYGNAPFIFNRQPSEMLIVDDKVVTNDKVDEPIKTTIDIGNEAQKNEEPTLITQVNNSEVVQITPQTVDIFNKQENLKPKKKRTLN